MRKIVIAQFFTNLYIYYNSNQTAKEFVGHMGTLEKYFKVYQGEKKVAKHTRKDPRKI